MSQENVEIVRRLFDAASRGDSEAVLALYDPSVEWDASRTPSGTGPTPLYRGHDGLRRFFRQWREVWMSDEYEYNELIDAGDAVISIATQRVQGKASGLQLERTLVGSGRSATPRSSVSSGSPHASKPSKPWGCRSNPAVTPPRRSG